MKNKMVEQKEALETLIEFNCRLVKNMNIIVKELSGARMDDTSIFLKSIIDAMNWEIEVMNGTMPLLNSGEERIHKDEFNQKVIAFGKALEDEDDEKMAEAIKQLIPEFENLGSVAELVMKW